jgi:hypothetical protein
MVGRNLHIPAAVLIIPLQNGQRNTYETGF